MISCLDQLWIIFQEFGDVRDVNMPGKRSSRKHSKGRVRYLAIGPFFLFEMQKICDTCSYCVISYHTLGFTDGCAYVTYTDDDSVTKVLDVCVRVNGRRDVLTVKKSNGRLVKVNFSRTHDTENLRVRREK